MKTATNNHPHGSRPRKPGKLVVRQVPLAGADVEFPGQGQRLFQLFKPELMRAFAARTAEEKSRA